MKHLFITIILFSITMTATAQKIISDKTDGNFRFIATSTKICRDMTDKSVFAYGLACSINDNVTQYQIIVDVTKDETMNASLKDSILIRTTSGLVFSLHIFNAITEPKIINIGTSILNQYTTTYFANISTSQLDALCDDGIIKIRVPSSIGNIDKEYQKDKAAKIFARCRQLISEALSKSDEF